MRKILVALIVAIALAGCEDKAHYDWTVFIYMAADNGLTVNADEDINEMEAATIGGGVKVGALVDRNDWASDSDAVLYEIEADHDTTVIGSPIVKRYGEINTASPAVLSARANDAFDRWPSSRRALIVWGHGNAWYRDPEWKSVCDDSESLDRMLVSDGELRAAMLGVSGGADLLCFDACLMQTAEVISEVNDRADCIVASLDKTCADGLPYDEILSAWNSADTPDEAGDRIARLGVDSYRFGGSQYDPGVTRAAYSSVHVGGWEIAEAAVAEFVEAVAASGDTVALHAAREQVSVFNDADEMVDLVQYLRIVADLTDGESSLAANTAVTALELAIPEVDLFGYEEGTTGRVSVWFPTYETAFVNWREIYEAMRWNEATGWSNLLAFYFLADQ